MIEPTPWGVKAAWLFSAVVLFTSLVTLASCGVEDPRVRVIDRLGPGRAFTTRDVSLPSLREPHAASGELAAMRVGADLLLGGDGSSTWPADRGGGRDTFVEGGRAPSLRLLEVDGVLVGADFDALLMLTIYAHFETASRYFAELGVELPAEVPVYFEPELVDAEELGFPTHDNAAFFPDADAFFFLPMQVLQDIPFGMNAGVVAHEWSHRVFYYEAWGGEMFDTLARLGGVAGTGAVFNLIRATDEGVADFFGADVVDDPAFLAESVFAELATPRDLSVLHVLDGAWIDGSEPRRDGVFDPYAVGAVVAAGLWALGERLGWDVVAQALVWALRGLRGQLSQLRYQVGDLERTLLTELDPGRRAELCAILEPAYAVVWTRFAGECP